MRPIRDLEEPSTDAIDYRDRRRNKFFCASFLSTEHIKQARRSNCYYLIGEKGSGKTALALHMEHWSEMEQTSKLISIAETQYSRFIQLRVNRKLEYTDYATLWRATLLYLLARVTVDTNKNWTHRITGKFRKIETAMGKYEKSSRIPELETVVEFVTTLTRDSKIEAIAPELLNAGIGENKHQSTKITQTEVRSAMLEAETILRAGLRDLKLAGDIVLFMDGLDAKPSGVDAVEFQKCLSGLAEGAWQLNSDFFSTIKDTKGRFRIVLLLRPDVFDSLDIHNSNCKLSDNSVVFHWCTTEDRCAESDLFKMADKYFTSQNAPGIGWNEYFVCKPGTRSRAFAHFLTHSFQRPRDIFAAIKKLLEIRRRAPGGNDTHFDQSVFETPEFTDLYAEYLLAEVKNYANYYMSNSDADSYLTLFHHLNGARVFNYADYTRAFDSFVTSEEAKKIKEKLFLSSPGQLLQFLYDVNVVGYKETLEDGSTAHWHWAYRERSVAKVMPKVRIGGEYQVHAGVAKALNIGKRIRR